MQKFNGPAVRYQRELRGVPIKDLARLLGWSVSHLTNIERGRAPLTEPKAREVALLFGITDLRVLYGPDVMPIEVDAVFPQGVNR